MKRINWTAALSKPVEKITRCQSSRLALMSADWQTCPCGNFCKKLERHHDGAPLDKELFILGCEFSGAVSLFNMMKQHCNTSGSRVLRKALAIHNKIERRAAKLLAKMEGCKV